MKVCGITAARCLVSGKWYVGGSLSIKRRWATHKRELSSAGAHRGSSSCVRGASTAPKIGNGQSWRSAGPAALVAREQHWIDRLASYQNGYNSLPYAKQGTRGRTRTPEEIARCVATRRARDNYKHSEETKKLIGDMQRGKPKGPMSEAQKQLLSRIKKERGMPETERQRIAKMARERVYTEEIRRNMAKAHEGYVMPEEQKQKIAAAHRGKPQPLAAIAKMIGNKMALYGWSPSLGTCRKYGLPVSVVPTCPVCGEEILGRRVTCSPECFVNWQRRNAKRRQPIKCAVCGGLFTPNYATAKTCSRGCFRELARNNVNARCATHAFSIV